MPSEKRSKKGYFKAKKQRNAQLVNDRSLISK